LIAFGADKHVLTALRAGAAGFLLMDTHRSRSSAALREVAVGQPVL
jgi:DNA-binding NarL/FixJ family response regulator